MKQAGSTPIDVPSDVTISDIRFEHLSEPLGIGVARPRLSWTVVTSIEAWTQASYEIEACEAGGPTDAARLRGQTGLVESGESVLVAWPFAPLASRERLTVRVRVRGSDGSASAWSARYPVEAGLLQATDWTAQFVTPDWEEDPSRALPAPLLRREFAVRPGFTGARLYITALGVYEARLNGVVVGDHVLAPGWTSYDHRLRYQIFDVTGLVQEGSNALGAMLGDGWFRGGLGFGGGRRNLYGDRLGLLAQLEIAYEDGSTDIVGTDDAWRAARGPILMSDIYNGETYDARLEQDGWSEPGFDDRAWAAVRGIERDLATLVAPVGPPVRGIESMAPVEITTSPSGRTIIDFGQNLVGRLRLTVRGEAGQTITLRHAEVLEDGELSIRPLRFAEATDRYTLRGGDAESWEPRFTFHGFRYAEVTGLPGELQTGDIRAVVCHSDMARTGWFECSDPLINRLHENIVWSMRGNFLDIPTDCPQRDERLGWTGDIQVFSPTACFLYDASGFLQSWLRDLAAEQRVFGAVPFVVPTVMGGNPPAAAWGDAATVVPWVLYQRFGDTGILHDQFESMRAWVDLLAETAGPGRLWNKGFQFGDWLDPIAPPEKPAAARADPAVVATAYFAHSAQLLGQAAQVLGRTEDAARYLGLADEVRAAFNREYVTPNGRVLSDCTTIYAQALEFGLLADAEQRRRAGIRLAALVRDSGYRISTGFVGTPLVCDALCSVGEYDAAFRLLTQRACPSWLYPVTMGGTTIWERWDSMRPDGSVNPGEMTSFNHYALGAVADWLHRTVGGLAPAAPGYRRLELRPYPGGGLTHASARHLTPYGLAECAWKIEAGQLEVSVVVPPNTTARVVLPRSEEAPVEVGSGTHRWSYPFQETLATRLPLSLDSTLNQLVDDPDAWTAVLQAVPEFASSMETGVLRAGSAPVRQGIAFMPNAAVMREGIAATLENIGRERDAASS